MPLWKRPDTGGSDVVTPRIVQRVIQPRAAGLEGCVSATRSASPRTSLRAGPNSPSSWTPDGGRTGAIAGALRPARRTRCRRQTPLQRRVVSGVSVGFNLYGVARCGHGTGRTELAYWNQSVTIQFGNLDNSAAVLVELPPGFGELSGAPGNPIPGRASAP